MYVQRAPDFCFALGLQKLRAGPVYMQKYFLKSFYPLPSILKKIFTLIYFSQMAEGV
jgi:hypothetical protein